MTKKEAFKQFKLYHLNSIRETYEQDGIVDESARCESWNNYTDFLCKNGQITDEQYHHWNHPSSLYPKSKLSIYPE